MTPPSTATMSGALFGLGAISSLIGGVGRYQAGQSEKAAYDYNASVTIQNMKDEDAANQEQTSTLIGRQATAYSASGVDIASGSPLLVMAATAARGAKKGEQIVEAGTEEAALQRYYGKIAAFNGTMGGISTFLSGFTKAGIGYYGATSPSLAPTPNPQAPYGPDSD